ncbi:uncharacterized protein LOC135496043 [Lineus longissimus]|uniref:uncharacterized protein LOC135496043 n=1 Tax=Lineus longissimus TaxID=88925 RepID=UPI002B4F5AEB
MSEGMKIFLGKLNLSEIYTEHFEQNGYDRVQDICQLEMEDLDIIKIFDEDIRRRIVEGAADFKTTQEFKLLKWLEDSGLGRYGINFIHNDFLDLEVIGRLEVERDLYDDLEIVLPGHRKRLQTAVTQLRKRRRLSSEIEDPAAMGYWRRPKKLQDSKNPFLCIDATIKSTKPHGKSMQCEFMVDSGSDVATITEADLDQLDLELLGTIKSRGVHSTKDKQLYRAKLLVGKEEIETEVIPESYESIGNHALRQFRHYINGHTHYWLKGAAGRRPSADQSYQPRTPETTVTTPWKSSQTPGGSGEAAQGTSGEKTPSPERVTHHKPAVAAVKKALFRPASPGTSGEIPQSEARASKRTRQLEEIVSPEDVPLPEKMPKLLPKESKTEKDERGPDSTQPDIS